MRALLAGAVLTAAGLALAATVAPTFGAACVALGWILLAAGIHAFARASRREGRADDAR